MIDYKKELIEIFKNDNSSILDITPKNTALNASQQLIERLSHKLIIFIKKIKENQGLVIILAKDV